MLATERITTQPYYARDPLQCEILAFCNANRCASHNSQWDASHAGVPSIVRKQQQLQCDSPQFSVGCKPSTSCGYSSDLRLGGLVFEDSVLPWSELACPSFDLAPNCFVARHLALARVSLLFPFTALVAYGSIRQIRQNKCGSSQDGVRQ